MLFQTFFLNISFVLLLNAAKKSLVYLKSKQELGYPKTFDTKNMQRVGLRSTTSFSNISKMTKLGATKPSKTVANSNKSFAPKTLTSHNTLTPPSSHFVDININNAFRTVPPYIVLTPESSQKLGLFRKFDISFYVSSDCCRFNYIFYSNSQKNNIIQPLLELDSKSGEVICAYAHTKNNRFAVVTIGSRFEETKSEQKEDDEEEDAQIYYDSDVPKQSSSVKDIFNKMAQTSSKKKASTPKLTSTATKFYIIDVSNLMFFSYTNLPTEISKVQFLSNYLLEVEYKNNSKDHFMYASLMNPPKWILVNRKVKLLDPREISSIFSDFKFVLANTKNHGLVPLFEISNEASEVIYSLARAQTQPYLAVYVGPMDPSTAFDQPTLEIIDMRTKETQIVHMGECKQNFVFPSVDTFAFEPKTCNKVHRWKLDTINNHDEQKMQWKSVWTEIQGTTIYIQKELSKNDWFPVFDLNKYCHEHELTKTGMRITGHVVNDNATYLLISIARSFFNMSSNGVFQVVNDKEWLIGVTLEKFDFPCVEYFQGKDLLSFNFLNENVFKITYLLSVVAPMTILSDMKVEEDYVQSLTPLYKIYQRPQDYSFDNSDQPWKSINSFGLSAELTAPKEETCDNLDHKAFIKMKYLEENSVQITQRVFDVHGSIVHSITADADCACIVSLDKSEEALIATTHILDSGTSNIVRPILPAVESKQSTMNQKKSFDNDNQNFIKLVKSGYIRVMANNLCKLQFNLQTREVTILLHGSKVLNHTITQVDAVELTQELIIYTTKMSELCIIKLADLSHHLVDQYGRYVEEINMELEDVAIRVVKYDYSILGMILELSWCPVKRVIYALTQTGNLFSLNTDDKDGSFEVVDGFPITQINNNTPMMKPIELTTSKFQAHVRGDGKTLIILQTDEEGISNPIIKFPLLFPIGMCQGAQWTIKKNGDIVLVYADSHRWSTVLISETKASNGTRH